MFGASVLASPDSTPILLSRALNGRYRLVHQERDAVLLENTSALPRVLMVPRAEVWPGDSSLLYRMVDGEVDPRERVILEEPLPTNVGAVAASPEAGAAAAHQVTPARDALTPSPSPGQPDEVPARGILAASPGEAEIVGATNQSVAVHTIAAKPAWLVLADPYYPGWRAFVDGIESKIYRANYLFRAVWVPEGTHDVVFVFDPASLWLGLGISLGALVLLLILTAVSFLR